MWWPSWEFCALCSRWICFFRWLCGILTSRADHCVFMFCNALDRSWPSAFWSGLPICSNSAVSKRKLQQNLLKTVGNFIHVQLQPPCLLPASVWCPAPTPQLPRFVHCDQWSNRCLPLINAYNPVHTLHLAHWTEWEQNVTCDFPFASI